MRISLPSADRKTVDRLYGLRSSFESPDPDAPVANVYVQKSAFGGGPAPRRITLVIEEDEGPAAAAR